MDARVFRLALGLSISTAACGVSNPGSDAAQDTGRADARGDSALQSETLVEPDAPIAPDDSVEPDAPVAPDAPSELDVVEPPDAPIAPDAPVPLDVTTRDTAVRDSAVDAGVDARAGDAAADAPLDATSSAACASGPGGAMLPQTQAYQRALRNYLSTLTAADFTVPDASVTFTAAMATGLSDDELYRVFLALANDPESSQPNLPTYRGLRMPASRFVLSSIERAGVHALISTESTFSTASTFYYSWDFAGNPWRGSRAVLLRAFAIGASDLMMMDACRTAGTCRAPVNLMGALRDYAYVARAIHAAPSGTIAPCAVAAYDEGLRRIVAMVTDTTGVGDPNSNWVIAGYTGLALAGQALGDAAITARAEPLLQRIMAGTCDEAGFCRHQGGGYDASYEGRTLGNLVEGQLVHPTPTVAAWTDRFAKLKLFTALREPTTPRATYVGPSHFAPATSAPAALDQSGGYHPLTVHSAAAALSVYGRYLVHTLGAAPFPADRAAMMAAITSGVARANSFSRGPDDASTLDIAAWEERHYGDNLEPLLRHYQPGTYARLQSVSAGERLPALERGDVSESLGTQFVSMRAGALGVIVHGGYIDPSNVNSGFGGGALSALWTQNSGPVILGWNRGLQSAPLRGFTWSDLAIWPTHAVAGALTVGSGAVSFSSARVTRPTMSVDRGTPGRTVVTTRAVLSGSEAVSTGSIPAALTVQRTFTLDATGLTVATSATAASALMAREVYEQLPLWLGNGATASASAAASFTVRTQGSSTQTPAALDGSVVANVIEVQLRRFGRTVSITFASPQRVRFAASESNVDYQWNPRSRNLQMLLTAAAGPFTSASVSYTLRAL